jgi:hypothetical protein
MPKETFFTAISRWRVVSRRGSMPRVFGRGSRSQPAALVSDRDAFLERLVAVALQHELRRSPNIDLGYHAAKVARPQSTKV